MKNYLDLDTQILFLNNISSKTSKNLTFNLYSSLRFDNLISKSLYFKIVSVFQKLMIYILYFIICPKNKKKNFNKLYLCNLLNV